MLAAPQLSPLVRVKTHEYIEEKTAGLYGHGNKQRRTFSARLSLMRSLQRAPGRARVSDDDGLSIIEFRTAVIAGRPTRRRDRR